MAILTGLAVWAVSDHGCDSRIRLTVAAAPEIAPAVRAAGKRWVAGEPRVDGQCMRMSVTAPDPSGVAAAVAQRAGGDLDIASGGDEGPAETAVWIPDSSSWLARLRTVDHTAVPFEAPSIAMSPVVLALPEPAARAEGWPAADIGWDHLLDGMREDPPLSVGVVEPRSSAVGLSSLLLTGSLATSAAKRADQEPQAAVRDVYRVLASGRAGSLPELMAEFSSTSRPGRGESAAPGPGAALAPEWAIREYDEGEPSTPLAAVYPEPAAPALDYPYAIMARLSTAEARAAALFRDWLGGAKARDVLTRHGFRAPDGSVGPDFPTGHGVRPEPAPAPESVPSGTAEAALQTWAEVGLPARTLVLLDVSGSMTTAASGGLSRLELTREVTAKALARLPDDAQLGLWAFAHHLAGDRAHRELAGVRSVADDRTWIGSALRGLQPAPDDSDGLRGAVREAYAAMLADHDGSMTNQIVVITDGGDQPAGGISEAALLTELERLSQPDKPVSLHAIGVGPDVVESDLETIVNAVGGEVHLARDPNQIDAALADALGLG